MGTVLAEGTSQYVGVRFQKLASTMISNLAITS